jgi:radical SAM superfamily enzyme YgiQ (UPF0313 family)
MTKKKILFVQPTIYDDRGVLVKMNRLYFVGLAYPLLAAMTPPEWKVEICLESIEEVPWDTDASVVGIGGMGHALNRGKDIAARFKEMGKTVIVGGPMASLAPDLVAPFCDSILLGDAEDAWPELLADLERGELKSRYHRPLARLSTPLPRYELILHKRIGNFLPVQAGRGCPNSCAFCSIYCLYRTRYFRRPINEVLRDIQKVKDLGFKKFLLLDDNIVADREYTIALCKAIEPLHMRWMSQCEITVAKDPETLAALAGSGCEMLSFGLESIQPKGLAALNKKWCHPEEYRELIRRVTDAGIEVASEMIVGVPTDTRESLMQTIDWVEHTRIAAPKFYIMTPIPGTDLFAQMEREDRLVSKDVYTYTASKAVIRHPNLSTEELDEIYWKLYDELYTIRRILGRTVFQKRFFKKPWQMLFLLGVNLFYRWHIKQRIAPIIL